LQNHQAEISPIDIAILTCMISVPCTCRGTVGSPYLCQLVTLLPLGYICLCTYFALFSINAFNYNKLLPRTTTGASFMQNGSLMARFAAATSWNFLHMIHMDGNVNGETTVFTEVNSGAFFAHPGFLLRTPGVEEMQRHSCGEAGTSML